MALFTATGVNPADAAQRESALTQDTSASFQNASGYSRSWYAVVSFILMFGLSFVDRLILSLLAPEINREFGTSDTQIGLRFGLGFGVV